MIKKPAFRKLRGYAFDPSLSLKMDTATINDICYKIPWEDVEPGPIGEYLEVVDYDPTVKEFYQPVNLNNTFLLAQDGLDPSESNPQFHQQMVYSVAMLTIKNFEQALGRKILWSPQRVKDSKIYEKYVEKLRVYPHAMREANAYYSPLKKALLFGYFSSTPSDETLHMPDSLVFTCLSHDIIAHETTHAILDGMHNYYIEPTNPDMLAFHEAFSDIVALFQHFSFPEVLRHQIAKTRGDLSSQNLLGQLAQEFGTAIGAYGSLRDAIGETDPDTKKWKIKEPNSSDYRTIMEPHARGSILVAAIFEAFINIYKCRVVDLLRIASEGTGILRQGALHPDLVNRLAQEASKAAGHVLKMCIRALDYCPPMDLTFGDYLRAIITADADLVADDEKDYRLAFIESFRKRGIYPEGIRTLSVDSLRFPLLNLGDVIEVDKNDQTIQHTIQLDESINMILDETRQLIGIINGFLRDYANEVKYVTKRKDVYDITRKYIKGDYEDRENILLGLHRRINVKFSDSPDFAKITGLGFVREFKRLGISPSRNKSNFPTFEIQNLRLATRTKPNGGQLNHVIFSIIQRTKVNFKNGVYLKSESLKDNINEEIRMKKRDMESIIFCGGCTLIFDLDNLQLKYAITKPLLDVEKLEKGEGVAVNMKRIIRQYEFQFNDSSKEMNEYSLYFGNGLHRMVEPFAFLHQH